MIKFIPTLSATGWIDAPAATADYLLSCYLTTNTSDSVLHREQNTSMQYTLKVHAGDTLTIEQKMTDDLQNKFQAIYGQTASVTVEMNAEDPNKPDQYTITFQGTIYDDAGKAHVIGKLVYFEDGRVVKIANLNNG